MYDSKTGTFHTQEIGSYFAFEKVHDEYGVSLIGEARIAKRNEKVIEALKTLYENGELNFSFEVLASTTTTRDNILIIDADEGNTLVGMAVVSIPAYPEAKALDLVAELDESKAMQKAFDKVRMELSEVALDTIMCWVWQWMREALGDKVWDTRVERVCSDCAILYDVASGRTFKMEYIVSDDGLVVNDYFEVAYTRKGVLTMNKAEQIETTAEAEVTAEAEQTTAEQVAPADQQEQTEVEKTPEAETAQQVEPSEVSETPADADTQIAAMKAEIDKMKAIVEELQSYKEKYENVLSEQEKAEREKKSSAIKAFASKQGLSEDNPDVAKAIADLDYEAIVTLANQAEEEESHVVNPFTASIKVNGYKYSLLETK